MKEHETPSKPVVQLTSSDGKTKFEIHAYRARQECHIFYGATGSFGGTKDAGLVYVVKGNGHLNAEDDHVDAAHIWEWVQEWMQKGMNSERDIVMCSCGDEDDWDVLYIGGKYACPFDVETIRLLERLGKSVVRREFDPKWASTISGFPENLSDCKFINEPTNTDPDGAGVSGTVSSISADNSASPPGDKISGSG